MTALVLYEILRWGIWICSCSITVDLRIWVVVDDMGKCYADIARRFLSICLL